MSKLTIREVNFDFDGVEFIWNPQNPDFSYLANVISFQTIGFERFICRTVHQALPMITDPELVAEAKDFLAQEVKHSKGHMAHVKGLIGRYPDLKAVFDSAVGDFDAKWEASSLEYRLAYSVIIEGTSLPLYKSMIFHRDKLMLGGDERVASLLLWHFSEEIEHRSSALKLFNALVDKPFYRLRVFPSVGGHLAQNLNRIAAQFARIVPGVDKLDIRKAMVAVPRWDRVKMTASLVASQLPFHNASKGSMPEFSRKLLDALPPQGSGRSPATEVIPQLPAA
jgi:predicted metal-dependent hydrolase